MSKNGHNIVKAYKQRLYTRFTVLVYDITTHIFAAVSNNTNLIYSKSK